ncbi:tetratricopeptide repeat protein [Henriciella aquimarina]|uniref:tetratricopeptide repeat protein n=1 Tax=Henriciella aquimarina TaxID=545261 RepID=UPI000A0184A9|nr:SEL1-like repeat protein [Henriciella aquimarina]
MTPTKITLLFLGVLTALGALVFAGAPQALYRETAYQAALRGEMDKARERYSRLAAFGDPISRNNVAVIDYRRARFESGKPLTRAEKKRLSLNARDQFFVLAQEELPAAMYNYAMFYFIARDDSRNFEHVKAVLRKAADKGDALSETAYALQLSPGQNHPDRPERMRRLKALADAGVAAAASEYANVIRSRPAEYSREYVQQYYLIAAQAGDLEAQEALGAWFDRADAFAWKEKAAAQGSLGAMVRLGETYERGDDGVEPDLRRALNWYERAIEHAVRPDPIPDMVLVRGGFRWRDVVFYRPSNINIQESAARQAANLLVAGKGDVRKDLKRAEELLSFADRRWNAAGVMRAQLEYAEAPAAQRQAVLCAETASALRTEQKEDQRALAAIADACNIRIFTWIDYLAAEEMGALTNLTEHDRQSLLYESKQSADAYLVLDPLTLTETVHDLRGTIFVIPDGAAVPNGLEEARARVLRLTAPSEEASPAR